jgi:hypothetical protein
MFLEHCDNVSERRDVSVGEGERLVRFQALAVHVSAIAATQILDGRWWSKRDLCVATRYCGLVDDEFDGALAPDERFPLLWEKEGSSNSLMPDDKLMPLSETAPPLRYRRKRECLVLAFTRHAGPSSS